jgi:uncharacterized membrane protein required for colicin V production
MIQLATVFWLAILVFALIGYLRGFDKELVSTSGIVLSLFILVQFDDFFRTITEGAGNPARTLLYVQAGIILIVTFFAYQTVPDRLAAIRKNPPKSNRDGLQTRMLGVLTGGFNGYLVFGSLWYYMDEKAYPLESIRAPLAETASAALVGSLPLAWLLQGNLLTLLVIGLFLFILIAVV